MSSVPTPIAHAAVGAGVAWLGDLAAGRETTGRALVIACAGIAVLPDLDILIGAHRTWSHSIGAALVCAAVAAGVALVWRAPAMRMGSLCGLAYASHILLDWLGADSAAPKGVMALWPLADAYYHSGLDIFSEVSRRYWKPSEFIWGNLRSLAREMAILGPPVLILMAIRTRSTRPRLPRDGA